MPRKYLLVCFCCWMLCGGAMGQTLSVDKFTNQLFFNIFNERQDPAIADFLQLYIPLLSEKKKKEPVWEDNTTGGQKEIHTFIFTHHPYLNFSFAQGKLEFFCTRNGDSKTTKINQLRFWLEFESQLEAEIAFNNLIETCIPISTSKKFSSTNGAQKAEFSDQKEIKGFGKIRMRLTADNLDHHIFKILFETTNDLP